jgi:hypothetical protein
MAAAVRNLDKGAHMKKWLGIAAAAAIGISLAASAPAEAASYTIYGPTVATGFDSSAVFTGRGCQAADARPVAEGGLTGIDSVFADISGRPVINANWSAQARAKDLVATLSATFLDGNCKVIGAPNTVRSLNPGAWSFNVPPGTKWLIVTSRAQVGVNLSF